MTRLWHRGTDPLEHARHVEAIARVEAIERRAEKVVQQLVARQRRNHWTESVLRVTRGDH